MMNVYVGDIIKVIELNDYDIDYYKLYSYYVIESITEDRLGKFANNYYVKEINDLFLWRDQFIKVIPDNNLNRLLFPELESVNGYLEEKYEL